MSEQPVVTDPTEEELTFWDRHRFLVLVSGTIVISLVMVVISLVIYNVSGSALLDLSRPGYQSVSDQVDRTSEIGNYSAFGPVNSDTIDEFIELFDKQADKAVDAFSGDPLNPETLEFGSVTAAE